MSDIGLPAWLVWALLSAAFAALTAIFAKVGVENVDSDLATFVRTTIVFATLGVVLFARGMLSQLPAIPYQSYGALALSGLATGASWICYFKALQLGDAARVAPVDKLSVVLVAVFAVFFLGESLALHNWLGILLIVAGIVLVAAS